MSNHKHFRSMCSVVPVNLGVIKPKIKKKLKWGKNKVFLIPRANSYSPRPTEELCSSDNGKVSETLGNLFENNNRIMDTEFSLLMKVWKDPIKGIRQKIKVLKSGKQTNANIGTNLIAGIEHLEILKSFEKEIANEIVKRMKKLYKK